MKKIEKYVPIFSLLGSQKLCGINFNELHVNAALAKNY